MMNCDVDLEHFFANIYGSQAVKYYSRYGDEKAIQYLRQALEWLNREIDHSAWDIDTRKIRDKILEILPDRLQSHTIPN